MPLKVIVVRGPIGAGKSSILDAVQSVTRYSPNVHVILEDMEAWQFYLEKFYTNPSEYVFLFQKEVEVHFHNMTKRLEILEEQSGEDEVFVYVERAPSDVVGVFLPLNKAVMGESSYQCLVYAMAQYNDRPVWKNAEYYNVECPGEMCLERIKERKRPGEENISLEYIGKVNALYAQLIQETGGKQVVNHGLRNPFHQVIRVMTDCLPTK